ncbi:MAG: thioredoxin domain-containing protein, partial [Deltaproteobacteria bacterium]|nr:thioredoxin domain-containing protein [Deltaproteobacteria bacterium]
QAAKYFRKEEREIEAVLAECRARLFEEREKRVKPFRDEKVIISWNGLMLSGVAAAYAVTGDARIREAGARTVDFIFTRMFENGLLLHTYKDGQAKLLGYLDDYAFLIAGLLDLFEATFEPELLERSKALARTMVEEFWDGENGGFFYTGKSHEQLISRTKPGFDSSIPSGNSVAAMDLLRIHHYTGDPDLLDRAEKTLRLHYDAMAKEPFGLSNMLGALDYHLSRPAEIVLVAARDDAAADALAKEIQHSYLPNKTLQWVSPEARLEEISPLLEGKTQVGGKPTVYVCRDFTCAPPVTDWEGLKPLLEE